MRPQDKDYDIRLQVHDLVHWSIAVTRSLTKPHSSIPVFQLSEHYCCQNFGTRPDLATSLRALEKILFKKCDIRHYSFVIVHVFVLSAVTTWLRWFEIPRVMVLIGVIRHIINYSLSIWFSSLVTDLSIRYRCCQKLFTLSFSLSSRWHCYHCHNQYKMYLSYRDETNDYVLCTLLRISSIRRNAKYKCEILSQEKGLHWRLFLGGETWLIIE